jgi:hypothetical protein
MIGIKYVVRWCLEMLIKIVAYRKKLRKMFIIIKIKYKRIKVLKGRLNSCKNQLQKQRKEKSIKKKVK